ncbi:LysR substrate-binding domain-containing protein [Erwinia sp. MMLR14_017]|uniref:LysR family transcriptional regulator n=1 Tax=Erwinia sp. MMLR14_017 TaxID=3093842 RepID=UPI0029906DCC|nr:LysR substrate-binding domain-containing protein [Erwinia sp. MMLR14_017]MDW8844604.1 LysR substrate-binding domain-containing protein [Erwinia sp. MMLR14_017]
MERLDCDRMFIAVMETGSFTAAAQRLSTSHGQASKLITRLENELAVSLFSRSTRSLKPTEVGLAYYERIRPLLAEYDALNDDVLNASKTPSGLLRISAPVTFGSTQLTGHLIAFARRYPDIELDVSFADRLVNVVNEGFDLTLRIGNLTDSNLIARKLCNIRIVMVASKAYLQQKGSPSHWDQLSQHDCIVDTNFRDPFVWPFLDEKRALHVQPVWGRMKFSNAEVCLRAALEGLGIARLPAFVAGEALQNGSVVPVLSRYEAPPLGLYAIYPPAKYLAQRSRAFIDFLAESFSGQPKWEENWL